MCLLNASITLSLGTQFTAFSAAGNGFTTPLASAIQPAPPTKSSFFTRAAPALFAVLTATTGCAEILNLDSFSEGSPTTATGGGGAGGMGGTAGEGGVGGAGGGGQDQYVPIPSRPTNNFTLLPARAFLLWQDGEIPSGKSIVGYEVCHTTQGIPFIEDLSLCPNPDTVTTTFTVIDLLEASAQYHWKVRTFYDDATFSDYSAIHTFSTDNSLISWWRLDEGAGTTVNDSAGNNNGIFQGSPSWTTGINGTALLLDGTSSVLFGDNPTLEGMNQLSVLAWINTTSMATNRPLVAKWFSGASSYTLRLSGSATGAVSFSTQTLSTVDSESTTLVNDGEWHHAAGTYDGISQNVFVDATSEDKDDQSGPIADSEEDACLGDFCDGGIGQGQGIDGVIDDIILTSRALTEEEILQQYCAIMAPYNTGIGSPVPTICQ